MERPPDRHNFRVADNPGVSGDESNQNAQCNYLTGWCFTFSCGSSIVNSVMHPGKRGNHPLLPSWLIRHRESSKTNSGNTDTALDLIGLPNYQIPSEADDLMERCRGGSVGRQ
jgi:hypothetical protein